MGGMAGVMAPFLEGVVSGTAITLAASAAAFAIGLALGIVLLLMRISSIAALRAVVVLWVSLIRGTPALIHMLIAYYMVPALFDISISPITAGIAALVTVIASEFIAGAAGIGYQLGTASQSLDSPGLFAWIVIACLVTVAVNLLFSLTTHVLQKGVTR